VPVYDYECEACGEIFERIAGLDEDFAVCPRCHNPDAKRIISLRRKTYNEVDPPWLKEVVEIVDPDGGPHCKEFIKNPTRENWRKWMKEEKIRPLEPGEERRKKPEIDRDAVVRQLLDRHRKRTRIEIWTK